MALAEWIFIAVSVIWLAEFVIFRNRNTDKGDQVEKRSFLVIFFALLTTIFLAIGLQEIQSYEIAAEILRWSGLLLFAAGVFLRLWGIVHLKNQFTRHVTVSEGDQIVSTGPYRKLRHPLYTGLLLIALGMALFFTSLIAAVWGALVVTWSLIRRIESEEQLLLKKFGPEYGHWMESRARLLPYIY